MAQEDAVHGVCEVNHVTWAKRPWPRQEEPDEAVEEEEIVISTGDDGEVKILGLDINDGRSGIRGLISSLL